MNSGFSLQAPTTLKRRLTERDAPVSIEGTSGSKASVPLPVDLTRSHPLDGCRNTQRLRIKRSTKKLECKVGSEKRTALLGPSRIIWSPTKVNKVHPLSFPELACPSKPQSSKTVCKETPITLDDAVKAHGHRGTISGSGVTEERPENSLDGVQEQISLLSESDCEMVGEADEKKKQSLGMHNSSGKGVHSTPSEKDAENDEVILIQQKESQVHSRRSDQGLTSSPGAGESAQTQVTGVD